ALAGPPPAHRYSTHPLRLGPSASPVPVLPWPAAVCAASSRRSHIVAVPRFVAGPKRWPRSSAWSPTTWLETTIATECVCPERSCPQSPRPDADRHHTATGLSSPANSRDIHSADSESHPASAVAPDTPGRPPHL